MKQSTWLVALAALLMFALPQSVLAQAKPIYSYVEAGYNEVDVDKPSGILDDSSGEFAGISFSIGKKYHGFGRYISNTIDDSDIDLKDTIVGVGWHGGLGEKADLVMEVAWIDQERGDFDEDGYFGRVGFRWRLIKLVEVGGWIRYQDVGVVEDEVYELNAMVHLWRLAIGLGLESQDENDTYNAFARFNFGG